MLCPFPFPFALLITSPSFLSSVLLNHPHTQSKRGVKMHATSKADQEEEEEDFIDIVVSPSHSREFEFQFSSFSHEKEAKSLSPADELFYKGKLLPLKKLLDTSISPTFHVTQNLAFEEEEECRNPIVASSSFSTPLESCNISPSDSCRVSFEINPAEYFFQWSTEMSNFISCGGGGGGGGGETHLSKKPWCNKIRLIKESLLTPKLKSSKAYLRSLFMKSACSDEANCVKTVGGAEYGEDEGWNVSKAKEYVSKYLKIVKRNPFGQEENERHHQVSSFTMKSILESEMDDHISFTCHRKSFSEAIKRHCKSKCYSTSSPSTSSSSSNCSSSSSSFSLKSSNGYYEISLLKRSISANLEVENSIEGAIAYCKKSQLKYDNSQQKIDASEVKSCLASSDSRVCGGDNGRPEISRI